MELNEWLDQDELADNKELRERRHAILQSMRITYDAAKEVLAVIERHVQRLGGGYHTAQAVNKTAAWYGYGAFMNIISVERDQQAYSGKILLGGRSPMTMKGTFFKIEDGEHKVNVGELHWHLHTILNDAFEQHLQELIDLWFDCPQFNQEAIYVVALGHIRPVHKLEEIFMGANIDLIVPELERLEHFYKVTLSKEVAFQ